MQELSGLEKKPAFRFFAPGGRAPRARCAAVPRNSAARVPPRADPEPRVSSGLQLLQELRNFLDGVSSASAIHRKAEHAGGRKFRPGRAGGERH